MRLVLLIPTMYHTGVCNSVKANSQKPFVGHHTNRVSFDFIFNFFFHFMRITYSQRLLLALLNIDKYNNIVNNTKEYNLIKRKDKTIIKYEKRQISLSLSLSLSLSQSINQSKVIFIRKTNDNSKCWFYTTVENETGDLTCIILLIVLSYVYFYFVWFSPPIKLTWYRPEQMIIFHRVTVIKFF